MLLFKNRTFFGLFISTFFVFASFTAFFPVLPVFLRSIGGSNFEVGLVMSAFPVGVLVFRPVVGWLMKRKSRKWVLLFGAGALLISTVSYFLVQGIYAMIPVRFFHGFGLSAFTTASIVLISDLTSYQNRGRIMGIMGVANYLGFGLGPYLSNMLYEKYSLHSVYFTAVFLAFIALLALLIVRQDRKAASAATEIEHFWQIIGRRFVIIPSAVAFFVAIVQGGLIFFLPIFLKEKNGIDPGLYFLSFSVAVLLVRILAGRIADRQGRGIVIFVATLIMLTSLVVLSQVRSAFILIIGAALYGIGYGSQQPTMSALVADRTTFATRSTIFSFYYAVFDSGILASGYIFGAIADYFSVVAIFPLAMTFYFIAIFLFLTQIQTDLSSSIKWILLNQKPAQTCRNCGHTVVTALCANCGHEQEKFEG